MATQRMSLEAAVVVAAITTCYICQKNTLDSEVMTTSVNTDRQTDDCVMLSVYRYLMNVRQTDDAHDVLAGI